MAKPAFIYAFDNLGPEHFTELCGELLGSRYKGFGLFLLGGVGPDGGVDAELDTNLGIWQPESKEALLYKIIQPGEVVIFQFKHKVVARSGGQVEARKQLLRLYQCRPENKNNKCELCRRLILQKNPDAYILVTNVEVNSIFRDTFKKQCQDSHPEIKHYQVIGLDELENWVKMETRLRHLYFPTIFGPPQYNLRVVLSEGYAVFYGDEPRGLILSGPPRPKFAPIHPGDRLIDLFQVTIQNIGTVPSYISTIGFKFIVDGEKRWVGWWEDIYQELSSAMGELKNPRLGTALEPGRRHTIRFPFHVLHKMRENAKGAFPVEILVSDEIGNVYSVTIPEELRERMIE